MKNKITVGIIIAMLLSISLVITPISGMKAYKIIEQKKENLISYDMDEIQNQYDKFLIPFYGNDIDKDEWLNSFKYLYNQVSRQDLNDIYQNNILTQSLDYLLGDSPDRDDETFEMMNTALDEKNQEEKDTNFEIPSKNSFENALKWDFETEEEFYNQIPEDKKEIMQEMFNAVNNEILKPQKQPYYNLLEKILENFQEKGIDFKNIVRLVLIFLWCIVNAGIYILLGELAALAICAVEGFAMGLGIATLSGDFLKPVCVFLSELLPQLGLSDNCWFSLLSFIVGLIGTGVGFLLLASTPLGQIVGGAIFLIAGIIGIEYLIDRYWPTNKNSEKKSENVLNLTELIFSRNKIFQQNFMRLI